MKISPLAMIASLCLAACSGDPTAPPVVNESVATPANPAAPPMENRSEPAPAARDGAPVLLSALTQDDIMAADLKGELGCSFTREQSGCDVLLVAAADLVDNAHGAGIIKLDDTIEPVSTRKTGGFSAMSKGGTFEGRALNIEVTRTGDAAVGGFESPIYAAILTARRSDGGSVSIDGFYHCGP